MDRNKAIKFLKSAQTVKNPFKSTQEILEWLKCRNEQVKVKIDKVAFADLDDWSFDPSTENLRHRTGKFFSIDGIKVNTNWGSNPEWTQPIINQAEIGFLGIISKEFNGVLYFLMQAKIEPGNVNNVQISPTLQATKSNYTRVHKGKKPLYLDYFLSKDNHNVLLDQLQSEQGARFLKKRNRNIIIEVKEEVPLYEDFCWLTLGQITELIHHDNMVNMDTRTVVSGISFSGISEDQAMLEKVRSLKEEDDFQSGMLMSAINKNGSLFSFDELLSWLTQLKSYYELEVLKIPLKQVKDWTITESNIHHDSGKYFRVIAVQVEIDNREVKRWSQPLIEPAQEGLCAFVIKKINGIYHFAVQAKLECGNFDILELAPTVQCLTGNYHGNGIKNIPFTKEVLSAKPEQIIYDTYQSEEGGRFYREQNRNIIVDLGEETNQKLPENYIWMSLYQLKMFLRFNNYLNIQARSLLSMIDF